MASGKSNDTSKSVKVSSNFRLFIKIFIKYNDGLFSESFDVSSDGGALKKPLTANELGVM